MANISKQKRERLLEALNSIRDGLTDDYLRSVVNEIELELTEKKYGLVWERHSEQVDEMLKDNIPVFSEVKEKEINRNDSLPVNFIMEGDNLHSLYLLEKTHTNMIDIIYIDPPYNTGGKDFTYDDCYVDKRDMFKHSKWLSFMERRLLIMQRLLRKSGVIFISIGEQEVASLKLLCDEIFGEQNYITIFSRQMKSGGAKGKYYTPNIDYVLCYAKNIEFLPNFKAIMTQKQIDTFYKQVEKEGPRKGEKYGEERLFKASLDPRPNQRYYIQCPDGSFAIPPGVNFPEHLVEGETVLPSNEDKVWKWIYPRYLEELEKNHIVFKKTTTSGLVDENGNKSKWNIYNKLWLSEQQEKGVVPSNFITEFENRQSAAEMKKLKLDFTYAKPLNLIKYLITIANQKNDITVLDCFAGSGTTGHAVMELNKEDGGCRKFILCSNNENKICEKISYERIKKVIEGYEKTEGIPANLKYYKTDFMKRNNEDLTEELLEHIIEMVQLEFAISMENPKYRIVFDDEELDLLLESESLMACKKLFYSTNVLFSSMQKYTLKEKGIEVIPIPEYYFEKELLEEGEF